MGKKHWSRMNPLELAKAAGLRAQDVGRNTYLYIDMDGKVTYMQKSDRNSYPSDEQQSIGYLISFGETLKEIKAAL